MKKTVKKILSIQWKPKSGNWSKDPLDEVLVIRYLNNNGILMTKTQDAYLIDDLLEYGEEYIEGIEEGFKNGDFTIIDFLIEIFMAVKTLTTYNNKRFIDDFEDHNLRSKLYRLEHKYFKDLMEI